MRRIRSPIRYSRLFHSEHNEPRNKFYGLTLQVRLNGLWLLGREFILWLALNTFLDRTPKIQLTSILIPFLTSESMKGDRQITFSSTLRERLGHHIHGKQWAADVKGFLWKQTLWKRPLHIISANLHSVMKKIEFKNLHQFP